MRNDKEICVTENCDTEQATTIDKIDDKCAAECLINFQNFKIYLKSIKSTSEECKPYCIEVLKQYFHTSPHVYEKKDYKAKVEFAEKILIEIVDIDYQNIAINALNYILFNDFHENLKYGEKHLDYRIDLAIELFNKDEEKLKDLGANACLEYTKSDVDSGSNSKKYLAEKLISEPEYFELGIKACKNILHNFESNYDLPNFITEGRYNNSELRNVEKFKSWVDIFYKFAADESLSCKGKKYAYEKLRGHNNGFQNSEYLYDQCHKNKVCIKEINESLDYLNDKINELNSLPDFLLQCATDY